MERQLRETCLLEDVEDCLRDGGVEQEEQYDDRGEGATRCLLSLASQLETPEAERQADHCEGEQ